MPPLHRHFRRPFLARSTQGQELVLSQSELYVWRFQSRLPQMLSALPTAPICPCLDFTKKRLVLTAVALNAFEECIAPTLFLLAPLNALAECIASALFLLAPP